MQAGAGRPSSHADRPGGSAGTPRFAAVSAVKATCRGRPRPGHRGGLVLPPGRRQRAARRPLAASMRRPPPRRERPAVVVRRDLCRKAPSGSHLDHPQRDVSRWFTEPIAPPAPSPADLARAAVCQSCRGWEAFRPSQGQARPHWLRSPVRRGLPDRTGTALRRRPVRQALRRPLHRAMAGSALRPSPTTPSLPEREGRTAGSSDGINAGGNSSSAPSKEAALCRAARTFSGMSFASKGCRLVCRSRITGCRRARSSSSVVG